MVEVIHLKCGHCKKKCLLKFGFFNFLTYLCIDFNLLTLKFNNLFMEKFIENYEKGLSLLFDDMLETARESGSTVTVSGVIIEGGK